jgi:hypothetical protein
MLQVGQVVIAARGTPLRRPSAAAYSATSGNTWPLVRIVPVTRAADPAIDSAHLRDGGATRTQSTYRASSVRASAPPTHRACGARGGAVRCGRSRAAGRRPRPPRPGRGSRPCGCRCNGVVRSRPGYTSRFPFERCVSDVSETLRSWVRGLAVRWSAGRTTTTSMLASMDEPQSERDCASVGAQRVGAACAR